MASFRGDEFEVVDWKSVASPVLPLVNKSGASFSAVGQVALKRAVLEGERRFCGNLTEEITGAPVELTRREKQAMLLDLRTVDCHRIDGRATLRRESKGLLKEQYVAYALCTWEFNEDKKSANAAKEVADIKLASKAVSKALGKKRKTSVAGAAASDTPAAASTSAWTDDEDDGGDDEGDENDDDEEDARAEEAAAAAAAAALTLQCEVEFELVFKNYRKLGESIDWVALSDKLNLGLKAPKNGTKHDIMELWYVDMGKVLKHLCIDPDVDRKLYGFLSKMATTSQGSIGALPASSFPERVNSVGNQVLTKGNTLLGPDEINKVVVLRMNRAFMKYMRQAHPKASQQHFNMTLLKPGDNKEEDPEDSGDDSGEEPEEEEEEPDM